MSRILTASLVCAFVGACSPQQAQTDLPVFGPAYPDASSSCRRVGENDVTNPYLGDDSRLFACQNTADATRLGGKVVATINGVALVSVPGHG